MQPPKRILFVCLGNICRSPAAEAVLREKARARELAIVVDSAGVGGWHVGEPPDRRMVVALKRRGYDVGKRVARRVGSADFRNFDYMLAMDLKNLADLMALAPARRSADLRLFLDFAQTDQRETPDPYHGRDAEFEDVLDLIEKGVEAFLDHLERDKG
ncbi:MAG: low molecular weight phosphotyrosine protein phosphatase [Parvularculaceae bacterium]|nr:low molecular weight phosphotyrosine protein phosphatase [Parvularculaceae bacterium]